MPFNGGGFGGGFGFGHAPAAPLNQYLGSTAQAVGVKAYGNVWASYECAACDNAIREMQTQLIRCANAVHVNEGVLQVDGKVGPATVATLRAVAQAGAQRGIPQAGPLAAFATPEAVAKNADTIRDALRAIGDSLAATTPTSIPSLPSTPSVQVSTTPTMTVTPPPTGLGPYASGQTQIKSWLTSKPVLIGGAILLVGGIAAAVILMTPPAREA